MGMNDHTVKAEAITSIRAAVTETQGVVVMSGLDDSGVLQLAAMSLREQNFLLDTYEKRIAELHAAVKSLTDRYA